MSNNNFQDKIYAHSSEVNTEELWDGIKVKRKKKRRILWFLFFGMTSFIVLMWVLYPLNTIEENAPISENSEVSLPTEKNVIDQLEENKLNPDSNTEIIQTRIDNMEAENENTSIDISNQNKINQSNIYDYSRTQSNYNKSKKSLDDTLLENFEFNPRNTNIFDTDHKKNSVDKRIAILLGDQKGRADISTESKSRTLINPLRILLLQKKSTQLLCISCDRNFDLLFPENDRTSQLLNSHKDSKIELLISFGTFSKSIKGNNEYLKNAEETEIPYVSSLVSLSYRKEINRNFFWNIGASYLTIIDNFKYSKQRTDIENEIGLTETIQTLNGLLEVEGNRLVSKTYQINKDILNTKNNLSLLAGIGFQVDLTNKLTAMTNVDFHYNILGSYTGQIEFRDDDITPINSLSDVYDQINNNQLGFSFGLDYRATELMEFGVRLSTLQDVQSISSLLGQKYRTYLFGVSVQMHL